MTITIAAGPQSILCLLILFIVHNDYWYIFNIKKYSIESLNDVVSYHFNNDVQVYYENSVLF